MGRRGIGRHPPHVFLAIRDARVLRKHPQRQLQPGVHRSGWDYVLQSIEHLYADEGVIFDDFVERTFLYNDEWHNNSVYNLQLWGMIESPRWRASLPQLRMLVAMAPNLQEWLQMRYPDIPVALIKHPTGRPSIYWTPERFQQNPDKLLLQVGWFCRNTAAIYQVPADDNYWLRKAHLRQQVVWIGYTEQLCQKYFRSADSNRGRTRVIDPTDAAEYDTLLSRNIIFMEVITAAANNTVIECIARNTPIVLNRHPGPLYYLGEDYPLFYDDIDRVPALVTHETVLQAHEYLKNMDKTWIRGACFAESLARNCVMNIPECRGSFPAVGTQSHSHIICTQ